MCMCVYTYVLFSSSFLLYWGLNLGLPCAFLISCISPALLYIFFETALSRLILSSLCRQGRPWTWDHPASLCSRWNYVPIPPVSATIFFINFSVDGCLGCFFILAIVHNATVNVAVQVSLASDFIFFRYIIPRRLLNDGVVLFSVSWGLHAFSIAVAPTHIPTSCACVGLLSPLHLARVFSFSVAPILTRVR